MGRHQTHAPLLPLLSLVRLRRPPISQVDRDKKPSYGVNFDRKEKLEKEAEEARMDQRDDERREEAAGIGVRLFAHPAWDGVRSEGPKWWLEGEE